MGRSTMRWTCILGVAACLAGCEEQTIQTGRGLGAGAGGPAAAGGAAAEGEADAGVPALSFRDEDFVEGDANRDPFRNFAGAFVSRPTRVDVVQRQVLMSRTAIDDMRLIAIVSGVATPSAMIVDTDGTGYTVHRGDFLGRAEVVPTGGEDSVPITLNWRVDRIRADEVVLAREDPSAPDRPPLTRVIALHEPEGAERGPR